MQNGGLTLGGTPQGDDDLAITRLPEDAHFKPREPGASPSEHVISRHVQRRMYLGGLSHTSLSEATTPGSDLPSLTLQGDCDPAQTRAPAEQGFCESHL